MLAFDVATCVIRACTLFGDIRTNLGFVMEIVCQHRVHITQEKRIEVLGD